jgi:pyruvate ferredoxin oxidoreductase beta subunit
MSKEKIQISEALADIMPPEYQEMVATATFGNEDRSWKDIGSSKELIEQHSLCAGCPESIAFRFILSSIPAPEDSVFVGSTGCTSLVFPHVGVQNIHSLFGNQNAVASGLQRALKLRFPDVHKDVIVLAGDGATVDIGLDMTMQSMAPTGKKFEKVRLPEIAFESGCHYVACLTVSKPNRVEKAIRNAIYVAREFGPTYVQLYTPCILEIGKQSMEGLDEMKDSEAIGGKRF